MKNENYRKEQFFKNALFTNDAENDPPSSFSFDFKSSLSNKSNQRKPAAYVYISFIPENVPTSTPLECKARWEEIEASSNEKVRKEKYCVWRLLCYALEQRLGVETNELKFKKEPCGSWSVEGAEISFSHSDDIIAVAISSTPVGIDVEKIREPKSSNIAKRIMTEKELDFFNALPTEKRTESLIKLWTAKEAIFKSKKRDAFIPKDYDTLDNAYKFGKLNFKGETYLWSCATDCPELTDVYICTEITEL